MPTRGAVRETPLTSFSLPPPLFPSITTRSRAGKSSSIGAIATIMGHEIGHNFGMSHTSSANPSKGVPTTCPSPTPHVMDPSTSSNYATAWTVCSQQYLKYYVEQYTMPQCLENVPTDAW